GDADLRLVPQAGVPLRGKVQLPASFDWDYDSVDVMLEEIDSSSRSFEDSFRLELDRSGSFVFPSVRPGGQYAIEVHAWGQRIYDGYHHEGAGGMVDDIWLATP